MNINEAISRIKIIYQDTTMMHEIQIKRVLDELHKSAYEEAIEDEEWDLGGSEEQGISEQRMESEA